MCYCINDGTHFVCLQRDRGKSRGAATFLSRNLEIPGPSVRERRATLAFEPNTRDDDVERRESSCAVHDSRESRSTDKSTRTTFRTALYVRGPRTKICTYRRVCYLHVWIVRVSWSVTTCACNTLPRTASKRTSVVVIIIVLLLLSSYAVVIRKQKKLLRPYNNDDRVNRK